MDSGSIRLGAQKAPQFNSALNVMGEIQGELSNLTSLWSTLSALMKELAAAQADRPQPTSTEGMKAEDAEKARQADAEKLSQWQSRVESIQGRIEQTQKRIEQSQQKLANLQGIKLPAAQAKDRSDTDRWMEEQRKNMEAMASASGSNYTATVGGDDNVQAIRSELTSLMLKAQQTRAVLNAAQVINTASKAEIRQAIGRVPPRNDGLTI